MYAGMWIRRAHCHRVINSFRTPVVMDAIRSNWTACTLRGADASCCQRGCLLCQTRWQQFAYKHCGALSVALFQLESRCSRRHRHRHGALACTQSPSKVFRGPRAMWNREKRSEFAAPVFVVPPDEPVGDLNWSFSANILCVHYSCASMCACIDLPRFIENLFVTRLWCTSCIISDKRVSLYNYTRFSFHCNLSPKRVVCVIYVDSLQRRRLSQRLLAGKLRVRWEVAFCEQCHRI